MIPKPGVRHGTRPGLAGKIRYSTWKTANNGLGTRRMGIAKRNPSIGLPHAMPPQIPATPIHRITRTADILAPQVGLPAKRVFPISPLPYSPLGFGSAASWVECAATNRPVFAVSGSHNRHRPAAGSRWHAGAPEQMGVPVSPSAPQQAASPYAEPTGLISDRPV